MRIRDTVIALPGTFQPPDSTRKMHDEASNGIATESGVHMRTEIADRNPNGKMTRLNSLPESFTSLHSRALSISLLDKISGLRSNAFGHGVRYVSPRSAPFGASITVCERLRYASCCHPMSSSEKSYSSREMSLLFVASLSIALVVPVSIMVTISSPAPFNGAREMNGYDKRNSPRWMCFTKSVGLNSCGELLQRILYR